MQLSSPEGEGGGGHPPSPPTDRGACKAGPASPGRGAIPQGRAAGTWGSRVQDRPQSAAMPVLPGSPTALCASAVPIAAPGWQRHSCPHPTPVCWETVPEQPSGTLGWRPAGAACAGWLCLAAMASGQGHDWGFPRPNWDLWGEAGDGGRGLLWDLGEASLWRPSLCQECRGALTACLLSPCPSVFQMSLPHRSTALPAPQVGY